MAQEPRRAALAFIFITVMLDMLSIGTIVPVLPKLVEHFTNGDTARAAEMIGIFATVWAVMQLFSMPVMGALSDRFGRRPVILASNFGLGADFVLMAMSQSLAWLFVGRLISGITAASISTASAYIADVTLPEKRSGAFGLLGAAFGVGFVLGPVVGGVLGEIDPRLPFWASAGLSLCNFGYGLFVLPESLTAEKRAPFEWKKANPVGALFMVKNHKGLTGLSVVAFLGFVAHVALPAIFVLYAGHRYNWDTRTVGLTLATVGVASMVVQAVLIKPIVARLGERNTMLLGLACGVAGFAAMGLAPNGAIFWLSVPLNSLWGLSGPPMQSLMSQRVGPNEQGQLQGAIGAMRAISEIIGPSIFTGSFAFFVRSKDVQLPGAPFLISSALILVSLLMATRLAAGARAAPVIDQQQAD
ncbi:MAG: TCR/Tet family MFS transporter [Myxococcaceae bacterium]